MAVSLPLTLLAAFSPHAPAQLSGELGAHDPSPLIKEGPTYYYFATGPGILSRSSSDRVAWSRGPSVFGAPPAWTTQAVPGFDGHFWAPDVVYRNGQYHLYYSVSTFGSQVSAIGLATSPTLNPTAANYGWTDRGSVIQSNVGSAYNTIDPSVLQDTATGRMWMAFGSYWNGIYVTELNPATGKRVSGSPTVHVASNSSIEAAALTQRGGYYYLFANWGSCCSGVDSTYNIRIGRSTSPTGPFLDKNGVDMAAGGGSLFLDDDGRMIGPGHVGYFSEGGQDYFGYHYYNGDNDGARTYGLRKLYWTADGWPSYAAVNPDWTGAAGANWSAAGNWSVGGVPNGVGHVATFRANSSGRYNVTLDGAGRTVSTVNFRSPSPFTIGANNGNTLTLDAATGDSATINVADGNHTIAAPVAALDHLGVNVTPAARTLTLSGAVSAPALTKYGYGTLTLAGANTYAGPVLVKRGRLDVTGSVGAGQFTSVGQRGDDATMTVRGTGRFTANSDLTIGDTGDASTAATGTLDLRDSATVTVDAAGGFFVGSGFFANTRAVGTVNQTGGTLTANGNFDGAFIIGGRNSSLATGTYNLGGGTVNANTNVRVGGRGTGTIDQTGGAFNAAGHVSIGRHAGATGDWAISAGTLNQGDPASLLIVGEAGAGTLTVSGTGRVTINGSLRVGSSGTGAGTVNLGGGVLTTPGIAGGAGTSTFNFNGGTLTAAAGNAAFIQGLTRAVVKAGAARIDTQGFNVTVAQPLLHDPALGQALDGGLTKSGAGTLTLAGANTYTGPTAATQGVLAFAASQRRSSLSVGSGAAVALTPGGGKVLVTGPLNIAGSAGAWAGKVDVADNALAVDWNPAAASPIGVVADQVKTAHAGGAWTGNGITSSHANANTYGVGLAESGAVLGSGGGTFFGQQVDGSTVLVRRTFYGDANIDGRVDGSDFALLAGNFGRSGLLWPGGDFNYDGSVTASDFALLAGNFGKSLPGGSAAIPGATAQDWLAVERFGGSIGAAVPEPGSAAGAAALCAAALLRRRRRPAGENSL